MENFTGLVALPVGSNIVLTWPSFGSVGPVTQVAVQRSPASANVFVNIATGLAATLPGTYTDVAPENGDWSYRLAVTVTQGGIDGAGTLLYSNEVNVSNLAATGVVTLSVSTNAPTGPVAGPAGYTNVKLTWTIDNIDSNDTPLFTQVQRSLNGGANWRTIGEVDIMNPFEGFQEQLQAGSGVIQYRLQSSLPTSQDAPGVTPQLQTPRITTSNVVSVTI